MRPAEWTYQNIANMKAQLENMGLSIDWARELATVVPIITVINNGFLFNYIKVELFIVKWYGELGSSRSNGLANEQVIDGRRLA